MSNSSLHHYVSLFSFYDTSIEKIIKSNNFVSLLVFCPQVVISCSFISHSVPPLACCLETAPGPPRGASAEGLWEVISAKNIYAFN